MCAMQMCQACIPGKVVPEVTLIGYMRHKSAENIQPIAAGDDLDLGL